MKSKSLKRSDLDGMLDYVKNNYLINQHIVNITETSKDKYFKITDEIHLLRKEKTTKNTDDFWMIVLSDITDREIEWHTGIDSNKSYKSIIQNDGRIAIVMSSLKEYNNKTPTVLKYSYIINMPFVKVSNFLSNSTLYHYWLFHLCDCNHTKIKWKFENKKILRSSQIDKQFTNNSRNQIQCSTGFLQHHEHYDNFIHQSSFSNKIITILLLDFFVGIVLGFFLTKFFL